MLEGTAADAKGNYERPAARRVTTGCGAPPTAARRGRKMNSINVRPFYYSQVRSDPKNPDRVYFSSTQLQVSDDGGKTPPRRGAERARGRPRPVDRPE